MLGIKRPVTNIKHLGGGLDGGTYAYGVVPKLAWTISSGKVNLFGKPKKLAKTATRLASVHIKLNVLTKF